MKNAHVATIGEGGGPMPNQGPNDIFGIKKIYNNLPYGNSYASTAWANGQARTLEPGSECLIDPYDPLLGVNDTGDPRIEIDGAGLYKSKPLPGISGSPRIRAFGSWQQAESSVYMRCPSAPMDVQIVHIQAKTEHYCTPIVNGFGGYIVYIDFAENKVYYKKEWNHATGYTPRTNSVDITLSPAVWYGFKHIVYNQGNNVVNECWEDTTGGSGGGTWTKISTWTDDGTVMINGVAYPTFPGSCSGSAIRTDCNGIDNYTEFKLWTVREIVPPP